MPEALALLALFAVVGGGFVVVKMSAGRSVDPHQELQRLKQHERWLQQRLERARRENWGEEMTAGFATDLAATTQKLTEAAESNS